MTRSTRIDKDFKQRAEAHWTKDRELKLTAGHLWPLTPRAAPELLRTMGLLNADASMSADSVRKFSQINHMVTLLMPQLTDLAARHGTLRILDACCGSSYLTLIIAWLMRGKWQKPCQIIGVDANAAVITASQARADSLGFGDFLRFEASTISPAYARDCFPRLFADQGGATSKNPPRPHLLVALHACDVATDLALALGVDSRADVIAVAPCCHAELASLWKAHPAPPTGLVPVFKSPNLRREVAAQMTDALRLTLMRSHGYEVTATEFVPSSHTPKNRLMTCIRRGNYLTEAKDQYAALKQTLGDTTIALEALLAGTC